MQMRALGAICSPRDLRDYKAICTTFIALPEKYEQHVNAVKDQGPVGSCVAHSLASVIENFNYNQENIDTIMSAGYIYGNRIDSNHKGSGMIIRDALKAVANYGTTVHEKFPYNTEVPDIIDKFKNSLLDLSIHSYPNKISSYYSISDDITLKNALYTGDGVIFSIPWYKDVEVENGIIRTSQDINNIDGYHCMVIYGWNKDGWLIQNSWGTDWGIEGRAVLPYNIKRSETWGVRDTISHNEAKKEWMQKASKKIDEYITDIEDLKYKLDCLEYELAERTKGHGRRDTQEIIKEIEKTEIEISDTNKKICFLQDQLNSLEEELVIIKKPYSSKIGQFILRIINFILKIFKK